ncbi:MAG TPA: SMC-Scp complex subunit ScpB [Candidatus Binataceae bacterium]|nr:SMC-Scp complex subunit ScpB [Candidatus Binataceae bacterium]
MELVEEERLKAILESLLFAAGGPVTLPQLVTVLETVPRDTIRLALADLASSYTATGRGLVLEEIANGYQLRTAREHAHYVRKLLAAKPPRLSRPLLETLAIIAYRQPVTRPEIEQLRGVDCGGVIDTLLERRLIKIGGRKEAPGRPLVYITTPEFLEVFGLKDIAGLPDLDEFRAIDEQRVLFDPPSEAGPADDSAATGEKAAVIEEAAAGDATVAEEAGAAIDIKRPQEQLHGEAGNGASSPDEIAATHDTAQPEASGIAGPSVDETDRGKDKP